MIGSGSRNRSRWSAVMAMLLAVSLLAACGGEPSDPEESGASPTASTAAMAASTEPSTPASPPTPTPEPPPPLTVESVSITSSEPEQGWITHRIHLAVRNTSQSPVILSSHIADSSEETEVGLASVTLQAGTATVNTDLDELYAGQVNIPGFDTLVIPPGIAISNPSATSEYSSSGFHYWEFRSFYATVRVPELLNPTQLTISPGLVHNGKATPVDLDLIDVPQQNSALVNPTIDGSPLAPFEYGPLTVEITARPGSLVGYHPLRRYDLIDGASRPYTPEEAATRTARQTGMFVSVIDVTITNTDITRDQPVDFGIAVLDGYGTTYPQVRRSDIPSVECSWVPAEIGPGQTFSGQVCFGMPEINAAATAPLGLLVTSPDDAKLFTLYPEPAKLTNCAMPRQPFPGSFMAGGSTYGVLSDQTIPVPGTAEGTINLDEISGGIDRITIEASGGETISIRVSPSSPNGSPSTRWLLLMYDPVGVQILSARDNADVPLVVEHVTLYCEGAYSFYIRPYGGRTTPSGDINYQVTVTVDAEVAATPQASPEPVGRDGDSRP